MAFDTAGLPPDERFAWWCETVRKGVAPTRITSDAEADFSGSMTSLDLGDLRLTTLAFPELRSERTEKLIRAGDPETYELTLILGGAMWISQGRDEADLSAGDFAVWTSSRPYRGRAAGGPAAGDSRALIVHLPRALVPLPEARVDQLLARGLPARSGVGRIFAEYLNALAGQGPTTDERDRTRLGATTLDLAAGFLAHLADAQGELAPETRHQVLLARIDTFIQDNLADPRLTPRSIAAHHHISVRLLHHLFRGRDETVSATVRRRRLERCHADLAAPPLRTVPVHAIGARWGLSSAAAFSHAFRAAYGMPPGEFRQTALRVHERKSEAA
ncbi:AraC-like ligand-binding domain-containing protein [Streptomyces sp. TE33382]